MNIVRAIFMVFLANEAAFAVLMVREALKIRRALKGGTLSEEERTVLAWGSRTQVGLFLRQRVISDMFR